MALRGTVRTLLCASTALAGVAVPLVDAGAGGLAVREQSTYYQGMVFAGAAAGGGPSISSMFWNPATMTQAAPGLTTESAYTAILGVTNITPTAASNAAAGWPAAALMPLGGGRDLFQDAIVPASYTVWRPTENWAFGVSINAPFGLVTNPSRDTAFMFYSRLSQVITLNVTPQVAYKFNDWISVGVGLQGQYMTVRLDNAFPGTALPPGSPAALSLQGESIDFGFVAGVTVTPSPWTTIGIGYRSQINQTLKGEVSRPAFLSPLGAVPAAIVGIAATVPLPQSINIGIRQKVSETFTVLGTFEWTNWSRFGRVAVRAIPPGVPGIPVTLPFDWEDGWFGSVGVEYQFSPALLLRAGLGLEHSPIRDQQRSTRLPDNDRTWLGAGLTYNWSQQLAFELGYSHVFVRDGAINIGPGQPLFDLSGGALGTFSGVGRTQVDIISLGFRYRFGDWPPRAIVTKG